MFKRFFLFPVLLILVIALSLANHPQPPDGWYPPNVEAMNLSTDLPKALPPRIEMWEEGEGERLAFEEIQREGEALSLGERAFEAEFAAGTADDPEGRDRWFWEQRAYPGG
ncbi:MAG: hypothetical protein D6796_14480, partial [Caldilineae bacterium]